MVNIEIAKIVFKVKFNYASTVKFLNDYLTDKEADYVIEISEADIENEQTGNFSPAYLETIALLRKIAEIIPQDNCMLCHGAAISCDHNGYIFMAPSQTGKTTHVTLWQKYLKDRVLIVNGDKPILRFCNDEIFVHGTPWAGKEGINCNTSVKLKAICFLKQSKENYIEKLSMESALNYLMKQVYLSNDIEVVNLVLQLVDRLLRLIPCYLLGCNISYEAFELSYQTLTGGKVDEN